MEKERTGGKEMKRKKIREESEENQISSGLRQDLENLEMEVDLQMSGKTKDLF